MSKTTINMTVNNGILSTGEKSINIYKNKNLENQNTDDINWEILNKEISTLKSNSELAIKIFAQQVEEVAEKKDKQGLFKILKDWIPNITNLISSSYYIIEIAKNFVLK